MGKKRVRGNKKGKRQAEPQELPKKNPRIVDHVSDDSDDEEIPEDEAFNSDDERKYGTFFADHDSEDEEDSSKDGSDDEAESDEEGGSEDDSDEEEEGDGGKYMLDLLNKLDDKGDNEKAKIKTTSSMIANNVKESEFSASVVPKAGITLDALMEGIKDTKGFGAVQKTMKKVAEGKATSAPVDRIISERAKRKVHYKGQSKEISKWIDVVQQNRKAETLDFRPKEKMEITRDVLIDKFVPTTDFEKQIHAALEEAGQKDEEEILKAEEAALNDDLGANEISLEEFKKRRGQLAKMRALMFYHEQKRHHINKIKSKKYRKIRKKQKEKQKAAELEAQVEEDPDLARELAEKEEVERMKERMTLAHKNTSKWAKRILKRGKNVDVDTRRALSAQLQRGDDLRKRMASTRQGDDSDDDENLVESARKVLLDTEKESDEAVQGSGLFKLSFMKKGIEKQREKAKQEARQLLMELEANEEYAAGNSDREEKTEQKASKKSKIKMASKKEMKEVLQDGEMVASSLKFGNATAVTATDVIDVNAVFEGASGKNKKNTGSGTSEHTATIINTPKEGKKDEEKPSSKSKLKKSGVVASSVTASTEESNPWLLANEGESNEKSESSKIRRSLSSRSKKTGYVDVERAIDLLDHNPNDEGRHKDYKEKEDDIKEKNITTLTQEELVRKAFTTISEQEAEEEFAKEKANIAEQEDPTRKVKRKKDMDSVSGWGSWVGDGAPPPPKKSRNLPKHLQPPKKKELPKQIRADEKKPNVIISAQRVKSMADKYMMQKIPHPYTSREEYERAMAGGVGREWNVTSSFKDMTRAEIITRAGKIIQPLSQRAKPKRAPAKF